MVLLYASAAAVFALDLLTKELVQATLDPWQTIPVLPGLFHLTYVRNPGAAFGLLPNQTLLFVAVSGLVVAGILLFGPRLGTGRPLVLFALGLELGGAAGNLLDRLRWGTVVDFLDFRVWPVFNIADTAIVVGGGLLLLHLLRESRAPGGA